MLTPSPNGARWPEPQPLANPGRFRFTFLSDTRTDHTNDSLLRPRGRLALVGRALTPASSSSRASTSPASGGAAISGWPRRAAWVYDRVAGRCRRRGETQPGGVTEHERRRRESCPRVDEGGAVDAIVTTEPVVRPAARPGRLHPHPLRAGPERGRRMQGQGSPAARRSGLRSYPNHWCGISGYLDDDRSVEEKARQEMLEEVGIAADRILSMQRGVVLLQEAPQSRQELAGRVGPRVRARPALPA